MTRCLEFDILYLCSAKIIYNYCQNNSLLHEKKVISNVKFIKLPAFLIPQSKCKYPVLQKAKRKSKGKTLLKISLYESTAKLKPPLSKCNMSFIFDVAMKKCVGSVTLKSRFQFCHIKSVVRSFFFLFFFMTRPPQQAGQEGQGLHCCPGTMLLALHKQI